MTPLLLVAMLLGQAVDEPQALVLLTRRTGATAPAADAVARDLRKALSYEGIETPIAPEALAARLKAAGIKATKGCEGNLECAAGWGRKLKVPVVVSLAVGQTGKELTVRIDALKTEKGERLAFEQFTMSAKDVGGLLTAFAPFSVRLRAVLSPRLIPKVAPKPAPVPTPAVLAKEDAPKQVKKAAPVLAPKLDTAEPSFTVEVTQGGPAPSRVPMLASGGAALLTGGVAAVLLGTGLSAKGRLDQRVSLGGDARGSPLTHSEAQSLAGSANAQLTASLVCGLTSLAFGTAAAVLFATRAEQ